MKTDFDIIIVGGGIAGMTAAIYAARANMSVLLLEKEICGGLANQTDVVENFPSYFSIHGMDLMEKVKAQVEKLDVTIEEITEVNRLNFESSPKLIETDEKQYSAYSIILASGRVPCPLPVENDWEEHIHYCSICDGNLYENKDVLVVGGGNSGFDESLYLASLGVKSIHIIETMDTFAADQQTQDKVKIISNITTTTGLSIIGVKPKGKKAEIMLQHNSSGRIEMEFIDGIFVFIGQKPNTDFLSGEIDINQQGYILTNQDLHTNISGVFAAGDVIVKKYRQLTTAMSDGTIAAMEACQYINSIRTS
jgi:thioredoxin reductase (NADPH)